MAKKDQTEPVIPEVAGLPPIAGTRTCAKCYVESPLTEEFYKKRTDKPNAWYIYCRRCLRAIKNEQKQQRLKRNCDRLDAALNTAIDTAAQLIDTAETSRIPHLTDLIQASCKVFGGPAGIAAHLADTYRAAKPGSPTRQRILSQVMGLVTTGTEQGLVSKPVASMDDEELEAELQRLAKTMVDRGLMIHSTTKVPPAIVEGLHE